MRWSILFAAGCGAQAPNHAMSGHAQTLPTDDVLRICPDPVSPVPLGEALDRDLAVLSYDLYWGLGISNISAHDIDIGSWYVFRSDSSQDAMAGESSPDGAITVPPGGDLVYTYGRDTDSLALDSDVWWCVEQTQVTATTTDYVFTGAQPPGPLLDYALEQSDEDGDDIEDHQDLDAENQVQTNRNIWGWLAANPGPIIGRQHNYLEIVPGESVTVELLVSNLGRVGTAVSFSESLPPELVASGFSAGPDGDEDDALGWRTLTWTDTLQGAVDTDIFEPTLYDDVILRYELQLAEGAQCPGRHEVPAPVVTWTDAHGVEWSNEGVQLQVLCCQEQGAADGTGSVEDEGGDEVGR